jgi:hypothetical protein
MRKPATKPAKRRRPRPAVKCKAKPCTLAEKPLPKTLAVNTQLRQDTSLAAAYMHAALNWQAVNYKVIGTLQDIFDRVNTGQTHPTMRTHLDRLLEVGAIRTDRPFSGDRCEEYVLTILPYKNKAENTKFLGMDVITKQLYGDHEELIEKLLRRLEGCGLPSEELPIAHKAVELVLQENIEILRMGGAAASYNAYPVTEEYMCNRYDPENPEDTKQTYRYDILTWHLRDEFNLTEMRTVSAKTAARYKAGASIIYAYMGRWVNRDITAVDGFVRWLKRLEKRGSIVVSLHLVFTNAEELCDLMLNEFQGVLL